MENSEQIKKSVEIKFSFISFILFFVLSLMLLFTFLFVLIKLPMLNYIPILITAVVMLFLTANQFKEWRNLVSGSSKKYPNPEKSNEL